MKDLRSIGELSDLRGRTAVITGGAGHIARAMAAALCEAGAEVAIVDRPGSPLAETLAFLQSRGAATLRSYETDLELEVERQSLVARLRGDFQSIDILINNAGFVGASNLAGWVAPLGEQSIETWRRALEVNLTAPFHLSQQLAPDLSRHDRGSIINVGSIYGLLGPDMSLYAGTQMGNPAAYAASKGGLLQLTRWLATTLAPSVRVNCISPGGLGRGQASAFVERYIARTPLKRMGEEEDFMGAALYLASDLSRWVTGQNIMVDGGWSAW